MNNEDIRRPVKVKTWIKDQYDENSKEHINHTGCFSNGFHLEGLFHCWGSTYEEFDGGPGNYTVGLIELEDGTIKEILPKNIKFI